MYHLFIERQKMCIRDRYKSTLMQVLCDYGLADGIYKETYRPLFGKGGKVLHDPDYQTVDQAVSYTHLDVYKRQIQQVIQRLDNHGSVSKRCRNVRQPSCKRSGSADRPKSGFHLRRLPALQILRLSS